MKNKKVKKGVVIWTALFITVGAAALLFGILPRFVSNEVGRTVTGSGGAYDFFYDAQYVPLEEQEGYSEYLELDRYVHYKNGAQSIAVTEESASRIGEEASFFVSYFDAVISGDAERYNSMFSDEYLEAHGEKSAFTPQMVYDIEVERISSDSDADVFFVSYRIFRNNGTFRNDIYSDASRKVQIILERSDGVCKISDLKYFV